MQPEALRRLIRVVGYVATTFGFVQLALAVSFSMTLGPRWRERVADAYQASHDTFWASHPLEREAAQRVSAEDPMHGQSLSVLRRAAAAHAGLIAVAPVRTAGIAGAALAAFGVTLLVRSSRQSRRRWGLFGRRLGILVTLLLPVSGLSMAWSDFNHGNFPVASLRIEREWTQYWSSFHTEEEYWDRKNAAVASIGSPGDQTLNAIRRGVAADIWRDVWGAAKVIVGVNTASLLLVVLALCYVGSGRAVGPGLPATSKPPTPPE